jgi:hypothetical protein
MNSVKSNMLKILRLRIGAHLDTALKRIQMVDSRRWLNFSGNPGWLAFFALGF